MSQPYPIPRHAMIWLLLAMFAGILPHVTRLPFWVTGVCLLCGIWRIMVYSERWLLPGQLVRSVLVFSGGAAVWGHYGTLSGPDAGTALLILGFCFKLLETRQRRDLFLVVILGYFVVAISFLHAQEMLDALYFLLVALLITAALLGLNQSPLRSDAPRTLKLAAKLLLQALPLMLVLFLLVPRIGPMLALDQSKGAARTGLAEEVTPGDIANLSQSPELAFRVQFEGVPPSPSLLYWRALVLDEFDGRTWRRSKRPSMDETVTWAGRALPWGSSYQPMGEAVRYRVIMEPTDQRWLFALDLVRPETQELGLTRDYRLLARRPIGQPFAYQVSSFQNYRIDPELPRWLMARYLQLPREGNTRTRALVADLKQQASDPDQYVRMLMRRFTEQGFSYTLQPPTLAGDTIDQFLFETRRGFCVHYAGALVYMLRAAGIPARMVAGYLGGERNPLGNYLLVHQFDAHAWVEYWRPDRGWLRIDPTAVVAPDRINSGLEEALAGEGGFLSGAPFSVNRYRNLAWLNQLRLGWDYINFAWHRSVLGYNARSQREWLRDWFGRVDWKLMGGLLLVSVAVVLGLLSFWLIWQQRMPKRSPTLRAYDRLCNRLAAQGMPRRVDESSTAYLARVAKIKPSSAAALDELDELLRAELYAGGQVVDPKKLRRLISRII